MGAFDSLYSDDSSTQNFDSTGSDSLDLSGTTFGSTLGSTPSDTSSNSFWDTVNGGISSLSNLANMGLGVYKSVQGSSAQASGQPEKTPDGRYVANIAGQPTVLQPDASAKTMQLFMIGAIIIGAVVLLREHKG